MEVAGCSSESRHQLSQQSGVCPSPLYVVWLGCFPDRPPIPSHLPAGITEQLVDCSGGDEVSAESGFQRKAAALFAVLQEQRASRSIVFCNKIESCEWIRQSCMCAAWLHVQGCQHRAPAASNSFCHCLPCRPQGGELPEPHLQP